MGPCPTSSSSTVAVAAASNASAPSSWTGPRRPPTGSRACRPPSGRRADLRWGRGAWIRKGATEPIEPWPVRAAGLTLECRPAAGGQLGVFPEHAATWAWLDRVVRDVAGRLERPPEILSLFGYTGGATLACARAGARVAHVDASRPAVAWARRNAELSGLTEAPVRWLVEDARTFVRRERRRGNHYDGIVLDPPTYGHGTGRLADRRAPPAAPGGPGRDRRPAGVARAAERAHPGLRRRPPRRAGARALRRSPPPASRCSSRAAPARACPSAPGPTAPPAEPPRAAPPHRAHHQQSRRTRGSARLPTCASDGRGTPPA